ncbi:NAD-dependent epimerase/dehydratase family protein [Cytobacillus pseudoceanisediminis]|uniref:NAD-dependent epimerase/dehydratase family protein n=1 Tax=Cytobacillus pseudoceanisediminis TaxID=3051614 RepID=UPI0034E2D699
MNALETARECSAQFFTPSSIGAFGPSTPKDNTPQDTIHRPTTMYGVNKVAGELLSDYYYYKFGVDTRGLRFPGLISYVTPPGAERLITLLRSTMKRLKMAAILLISTRAHIWI